MSILVTGASGALGRLVVDELLAGGADDVVATTRDPARLADLADRGVEVRAADFDDPTSLPAAFAGAGRVLLVSTDAHDEQRVRQHRAAVTAAVEAGVDHVLYTSILDPSPANPAAVVPDHRATEEALAASGLRWTALRNVLYAETTLLWLPGALARGEIRAAAGDGAVSWVTRADCARAAAAALLADPLPVGPIDITGPEAIGYQELAARVSEAAGRTVAYVPITVEEAVAGAVSAGLPEPIARLLVSFQEAAASGALATVSSGVADLTGRAPETYAAFLAEHLPPLLGG